MRTTTYKSLLLLLIVLLLTACDGDDTESDAGMGGDDVGPGMMDGDEVGPGMMGDEAAGGVMGSTEESEDIGPGMMEDEDFSEAGPGMMDGTAWGDGAFESNGERIYFTGTSERSGDIEYTGGPDIGAMMMGGDLSCASCHGPNARGGEHRMHMEVMDAPTIRWDALAAHDEAGHQEGQEEHATEEGDHTAEEDEHAAEEGGYDLETFRMAVVGGLHPSGEPLGEDMPRWQINDADLRDLAAYLQSLEGE